ncbi:hypothetical protein RF55_8176 [Lasius niger]|uniref:Uncharacterized protein n=1 Tax=Lasius niger TaxID=67767 RepID=A0A0J7KNF4_LASNI|nr:hypothetical protein RF55_8176 [Lasius niger]
MIFNLHKLAIYGSAIGAVLGGSGVFTVKAQAENWQAEGVKERRQSSEMSLHVTAESTLPNMPEMPLIAPPKNPEELAVQQEAINNTNEIKEWKGRGNSVTGPDQYGQVASVGQERIIHAKLWKKLDKWGVLGDVGKFLTQPMPEFWNQGTINESFPAMNGQGHWCIEPMFFGSTPWGSFNNNGHHDTSGGGNNYTNLWWMAYSITDQLEVFVEPTYELNWGGGSPLSSPQAADTPFGIKYRTSSMYSPSLTLTLGGQAPTGRWDRLSNPNDGSGSGTWYFNFGVTMMYSIPVFGHPLISSIWASANQATGKARIHGMSTYGTEAGFDGWASPSQFGSAGEGFEYGLTKKFGLVLDLMGNWAAPTTVKGHDANGVWSNTKGQWNDQFQVVPGVEYAFSPNWGIVGQVSVPVVGRNSSASLTPEAAIVAYY